MAKDIRKTLRIKAVMTGLVTPYLSAIWGRPGAIIELASGGMNV